MRVEAEVLDSTNKSPLASAHNIQLVERKEPAYSNRVLEFVTHL